MKRKYFDAFPTVGQHNGEAPNLETLSQGPGPERFYTPQEDTRRAVRPVPFHFDDEKESDYVPGEAWVISASHKGRDVPALLLSRDLTQKLQAAVPGKCLRLQHRRRREAQLARVIATEEWVDTMQQRTRTLETYYERSGNHDGLPRM